MVEKRNINIAGGDLDIPFYYQQIDSMPEDKILLRLWQHTASPLHSVEQDLPS